MHTRLLSVLLCGRCWCARWTTTIEWTTTHWTGSRCFTVPAPSSMAEGRCVHCLALLAAACVVCMCSATSWSSLPPLSYTLVLQVVLPMLYNDLVKMDCQPNRSPPCQEDSERSWVTSEQFYGGLGIVQVRRQAGVLHQLISEFAKHVTAAPLGTLVLLPAWVDTPSAHSLHGWRPHLLLGCSA